MILREKLKQPLAESFAKAVIDLKRNILAYGCDLHIDCAEELLRDGSDGKDLWGANVYQNPWRIEYTSLINIRPADNNRGMEIVVPEIRTRVEAIVRQLLLP